VHDDPWSGQPSMVNEDFVHAVEEKIQENRWFTISSLSLHLTAISWSPVHAGCWSCLWTHNEMAGQCNTIQWVRRWPLEPHAHRISSQHLAGNNSIIPPTVQT
jgi:hypothetical protein